MDLNGVIKTIDTGQWMSMAVIKCNVHKGTAGEVMNLAKVKLARRQPVDAGIQESLVNGQQSLGQQPGESAQAAQLRHQTSPRQPSRNARHAWNFTRNIETQSGQIITIHPLFIFKLNGQPVI